MTPEQFTNALESLNWKQADFCRKTGTNKSTPSNWVIGKTPVPLWVDAYLGAMQDLAALHSKYLATTKGKASASE
jgi:transcriptional regulator with XRE-family HTH domain